MNVRDIYLPIEESLKTQKKLYKDQGKKWECMIVDSDLDTVKAVVQSILQQETERGVVRVCAWCKKVWVNGQWQDIGELMTKTFIDTTKVTHSICDKCKEKEYHI